MADAALNAIENNETYVMVRAQAGGTEVSTIPIAQMIEGGASLPDPNIPDISIANAFLPLDHPLLEVAATNGIYIGEVK